MMKALRRHQFGSPGVRAHRGGGAARARGRPRAGPRARELADKADWHVRGRPRFLRPVTRNGVLRRRTRSSAPTSPAVVEAVGKDVTGLRPGRQGLRRAHRRIRRVRERDESSSECRRTSRLEEAGPWDRGLARSRALRDKRRAAARRETADQRRLRRCRHAGRPDREGVGAHVTAVCSTRNIEQTRGSAPTAFSTTRGKTSPGARAATT